MKNINKRNIIETHPHTDFVNSHLEIPETTGATIYIGKLYASAERWQEPAEVLFIRSSGMATA